MTIKYKVFFRVALTSAIVGFIAVIGIFSYNISNRPDPIATDLSDLYSISPNPHPNATHKLFTPIKASVHNRHWSDVVNIITTDIDKHGGYVEKQSAFEGGERINAVVPASYIDRLKPLGAHPDAWIHPSYMDWVEQIRQIPDPVATEGPLTSVSIQVSSVGTIKQWMDNALLTLFIIIGASAIVGLLCLSPSSYAARKMEDS